MKPISQQTILITGSTDGVGKQAALALAKQGAKVLIHGRDTQKLEGTLQEIRRAAGATRLETNLADFASLDEVRRMAEDLNAHHAHLDMLINNAGIGPGRLTGTNREISLDGYELRFAVNYLAPFLLTRLLLPLLRRSPPSRIINVASIGQSRLDFDDPMFERNYDPLEAYRRSKLALIMFTFDLAEELKGEGITVNCLHPASLMNTRMVYESFGYSLSTIQHGLEAVMNLAISPKFDTVSGRFFDQLREARAHNQAYDPLVRSRLKEISERLTGLQSSLITHRETNTLKGTFRD